MAVGLLEVTGGLDVAQSFAKTDAALFSVTVATVSGADRPTFAAGRPGIPLGVRSHAGLTGCGALRVADEVTSGGASFIAMVETADFWEGNHVTVRNNLYASRCRRVFRQREMGP